MGSVLPPVADKPRYVAEMFGRIARRYDLMNTLMTGGQDQRWRRMVARAAVSLQPSARSARILDVGTGTGKLASAIKEEAPRASVIGVDFTEAMLRAAPRTLTLASADALRLPFPDACFDAVISAFLVRNLSDVGAGLSEQVRVLRPEGKLVILETTPGPPGLLRGAYRFYFRGIVPRLGQLIAGDPSAYTYLPESTLAFLEPARLAEVMHSAGLHHIQTQRMALGSVAMTVARKSSVMLSGTGGTA